MRLAIAIALFAVLSAGAYAAVRQEPAPPPPTDTAPAPPPAPVQPQTSPAPTVYEQVQWRHSRSLGLPFAGGRLVNGVRLPPEGEHFFTWDPPLKRSPNRGWRRWGNDQALRRVLYVLAIFAAAHPEAPRVGIGDIARQHGGNFGPRFGGLGHASHQNGLDVDVYYPRIDTLEKAPLAPEQVDRWLAQDLVDLFVQAGAQRIFVGPSLGLKGPRKIVSALVHHDDHLHVRFRRLPR